MYHKDRRKGPKMITIKQNGNKTSNNTNQQTRILTKILKAAPGYWYEITSESKNNTAKGMLASQEGLAYMADLLYDEIKGRLYLIVKRNPKHDMTVPSNLQAFLRLQNLTRIFLSSVIFDYEEQMFYVICKADIPSNGTIKPVVMSVFTDIREILSDNRVNEFWN